MGFWALFPFLIYVAIIILIFWFAINVVKAQKERNSLLKEISNKLNVIEFNKKEE